MDQNLYRVLEPLAILLPLGLIPASILFIRGWFRLKTRELELEAEFHSREAHSRFASLELRQAAIESALTQLLQLPQGRLAQPLESPTQQLPMLPVKS